VFYELHRSVIGRVISGIRAFGTLRYLAVGVAQPIHFSRDAGAKARMP
jgi:hypothetical protein